MVHLPQKEVSTRMSKEELEECAMSCIENNFKVLHLIKEDCFENYRAGTDEKRKIYLDETKDCSHAVYNNLYMLPQISCQYALCSFYFIIFFSNTMCCH